MSSFGKRSLRQLSIAAVVALVFYFLMAYWGRAGDCKPYDIDGQCGMSTFFGKVYGVAGGVVILGVPLIAIGIADARRGDKG